LVLGNPVGPAHAAADRVGSGRAARVDQVADLLATDVGVRELAALELPVVAEAVAGQPREARAPPRGAAPALLVLAGGAPAAPRRVDVAAAPRARAAPDAIEGEHGVEQAATLLVEVEGDDVEAPLAPLALRPAEHDGVGGER